MNFAVAQSMIKSMDRLAESLDRNTDALNSSPEGVLLDAHDDVSVESLDLSDDIMVDLLAANLATVSQIKSHIEEHGDLSAVEGLGPIQQTKVLAAVGIETS